MTAATTLRQPSISRAPRALVLVAVLAFLSGVAATVSLQGVSRGAVGGSAVVQAAPTRDTAMFEAAHHNFNLRATVGTGPTSSNEHRQMQR